MIYAITESDQYVLIIEPGNLKKLKEGRPMRSPDDKVVVCYTPDMPWTIEAMKGAMRGGKVDTDLLIAILEEAAKRPEVVR